MIGGECVVCINSHLSVYLKSEYLFVSVIKMPWVLSWIDYQGCVGLSCLSFSIGWLVICKYNLFMLFLSLLFICLLFLYGPGFEQFVDHIFEGI